MNLNLESRCHSNPAMVAAPAQAKRVVRHDAAAAAHAFADRLLYSGWLEDSQRDQVKLHMIRAIMVWAHGGART